MKKTLSILSIILSVIFASTSVNADRILQTKTEKTIARGVTLTIDKIFTDSGWQKCYVVTVDLTDPSIALTSLFDGRGISFLKNISNMAKEESDVVAAINADFFNWASESGRGSPLGLTYKDGVLVSSPSHDGLPSIVFTENNEAVFAAFQMNLEIIAPNGIRCRVLHVNKFHPMESVVMYTPDWGTTSPGSQNGVVELVAQNGKVIEIRQDMPPTPIPENGFVLATSININRYFVDNFKVGDDIKLDMTLTPNVENIKTAVGGGTLLVENGKVANFTLNIAGSNPRSAIGIDKSGKKLYLVAVDGRFSNTPGFTQTELANYLISIGVYNALNFDGGGSTTLVAKTYDDNELKTINTPSGGSQRAVATGFAVKSLGNDGVPAYLEIKPSSDNVFLGEYVELWSFAYDQYWKPAYLENPTYEFAADDGGKFEGNRYYPKLPGIRTITVGCNGLYSTIKIRALEKVSEIFIYPDSFTIKKNESVNLNIWAKDEDGFGASISNDKVIWKVSNSNAAVQNGKITATSDGSFTVSASINNLVAYANANSSGAVNQNYGFETSASFYGYPSYVKGSYKLSSENVKSGNYAGELYFDFTSEGNDTQAAHVSFGHDIPLGDAKKIGIWVSATSDNSHWLRAQLDTAAGSVLRITLADKVNWDGYKYLEADIPEEARNGYLTKIYLVQNDNTIKNSGKIYLDDLRLIGASVPTVNNSPFYDRFNHTDIDSSNAEALYFIPSKLAPYTLLNNLVNNEIEKIARNKNGFVIGKNKVGSLSGINNFGTLEKNNTLFVTVNNTGGGIRAADSTQWHNLVNTCQTTSSKNVVIILNDGLESGFTDKEEYALLCSYLEEQLYKNGKNVFLVSVGNESKVNVQNGIRYITINKTPAINTSSFFADVKNACYLKITTSGDSLRYDILPITGWN